PRASELMEREWGPPDARMGSLSQRTVATASDVLAGRRGGLRAYLAFVGPAVVASIAYMDPGNFATNIQAGARYGYELLWVVLLANLIAMLFQALSAKLGIVTGKNLAEMCREQFSRPVAIAMWIVSEIAAMATDLAEFLGGAAARGRHHRRDRDAARGLSAFRAHPGPHPDAQRCGGPHGAAHLQQRGGGGAGDRRAGQHGDGDDGGERVPRRPFRRRRDRDRVSHADPADRRRGGGGLPRLAA